MGDVYRQLRKRACHIASEYPIPDFYRVFSKQRSLSITAFAADPVIREIRTLITCELEDNFGHSLSHAVKVSLDAGTLMMIEGPKAGYGPSMLRRRLRVAQCAGLLHDICRKEKDHAAAGAEVSGRFLRSYPFSNEEREDICHAIRNHEAFKPTTPASTPEGDLVAACLYDADKFRWGPDNFTTTVWDMVTASDMPMARFMEGYPRAMAFLSEIRHTFRTPTGKQYGPQFIDIGMDIGRRLFQIVRTEYAQCL